MSRNKSSQFKEEVTIYAEGKSEHSGFKVGTSHDDKYVILTHLDPDYYGNFNRVIVQRVRIPVLIETLQKMLETMK